MFSSTVLTAVAAGAADTASSRPGAWAAVPDAGVQEAFLGCSEEARQTLEALQLGVGEHCLREDVPEVLARAAGRALSGADTAALLRCFLLDASGTISWREFERCWRALQQLGSTPGPGAHTAAGMLRNRVTVGAAQQQRHQAAATSQPPTAQQEVGWHHAAAPLLVRERCEGPGARYLPLRGTDVTHGVGEGSSAQTYFGMYL